jgi:WD40 repeat protein
VWRLALLPDSQTLVSGAKDGTVCFWDTSVTHPRQANITWPVKIHAWSSAPDSGSVLTLDVNGEVARWTGADFQEKEPLFEAGTNIFDGSFTYNHFSKDGRFLAIGSTNGIVSIWDVSRRVLWRQLTNAADFVAAMRFVADGNKLVTWSGSPPLFREWNLTTGLETQSWPAPTPYQGAIALSPDEQLCVAIGLEGDIVSRNLTEGNNGTLSLDVLEASGTAFSPDGKFFAVASNLGYARVWDAKTWKELATLRGFRLATHSVVFSPDDRRLATGGGAGAQALKLWDTDSWQNVITLQGSDSIFDEALFSPDGNSVGALSFAGTLHVWRAVLGGNPRGGKGAGSEWWNTIALTIGGNAIKSQPQ